MGFKEHMDANYENWFSIMNDEEILIYSQLHKVITSYEEHFQKVSLNHTISDIEISKMGVELEHYKELFNIGIQSILNFNQNVSSHDVVIH